MKLMPFAGFVRSLASLSAIKAPMEAWGERRIFIIVARRETNLFAGAAVAAAADDDKSRDFYLRGRRALRRTAPSLIVRRLAKL